MRLYLLNVWHVWRENAYLKQKPAENALEEKPYQAYTVAALVLETPCGLHNACVSGLFA